MNFDARHDPLDGCRSEVEKADGRSADKDDLALDTLTRNLAVDDIGGRDEAAWVMSTIVQPYLPVAIGGDLDARHDHALDAGLIAFHHEGRRTRRDTQQLDRERGNDPALCREDGRHAAHDAVPLRHDCKKAASGSGAFEPREIS